MTRDGPGASDGVLRPLAATLPRESQRPRAMGGTSTPIRARRRLAFLVLPASHTGPFQFTPYVPASHHLTPEFKKQRHGPSNNRELPFEITALEGPLKSLSPAPSPTDEGSAHRC